MVEAWAEDEEDQLPPTKVIGPDENGIKTVIEYKMKDNKKYKVVRKYKVEKVIKKIPTVVKERMAWAKNKFGQAAGESSGPNPSHTSVELEDFYIDDPAMDEAAEEAKHQKMLQSLQQGINKRAISSKLADQGLKSTGLRRNPDEIGVSGAGGLATGKYVIPASRGRGEGALQEEVTTLRLSNLVRDVTDDEIRALCSLYGMVKRVFLARDSVTKESKGFAYVSFSTRQQAEQALNALHGAGMHHMIINVEWAKPNKRDPSSQHVRKEFRTGYGKALPQNRGLV
eukprot:augustus_masked-scaffold_9-processed-gene-2.11-mRNA-1 protein AED:0.27 eAED:0.28 QI:0/-1/0/1/-1/1/1/0/283